MAKKTNKVYCPYCGNAAELVDSSVVYPQSYGMMWICMPCDAYTGVHRSSPTFKPLGTLAKKDLRKLRQQVHHMFDPLWKNGSRTRNEAYAWLAERMNLPKEKTHVAMFSESQCKMALKILDTPF